MSIYVFDTETTGVKEPRLVEAAWTALGPLPYHNPLDCFSRRYNPGKPIECGAMATHHITDEDVTDCPPASDFRLPTDAEYLIGHNIDFDYQVSLTCGPQPEPKRICTLALSRALWPDADSHSLAAMCYRLDRKRARELCPDAHGASRDIDLVRIVLLEIVMRVGPATWEDLWKASERARVPTHMPYGKHRGVPIASVPRDYKDWLLGQADVDPYLRLALKS